LGRAERVAPPVLDAFDRVGAKRDEIHDDAGHGGDELLIRRVGANVVVVPRLLCIGQGQRHLAGPRTETGAE
jgi:hypothetical protein